MWYYIGEGKFMDKENKNNVVCFSDNTGRLMIGNIIGEDGDKITIEQPMVIVAEEHNGKINLRFIPYVYIELLDSEKPVLWEFNKSCINFCQTKPTERTIEIYNQMFDMFENSRKQTQGGVSQSVAAEQQSIVDPSGDVIEFKD